MSEEEDEIIFPRPERRVIGIVIPCSDPQELKRLVEDVKTTWYGFAIGTHSGIDAVNASAALYKAMGTKP